MDGSQQPALGSRYDALVERLKAAIMGTRGAMSDTAKRAILERDTRQIPPVLVPYILKVALHAYKVSDDDVQGLKREKLSEDEIFEATTCAAVGAALLRLEKGMAALRGAEGAR